MSREVDAFEADLHELVAFDHDCMCRVCLDRRRRDRARMIGVWLLLSLDEQQEWLTFHQNDELGAMLERALMEAAEDGRDLVALHDEFERRRPKEDT